MQSLSVSSVATFADTGRNRAADPLNSAGGGNNFAAILASDMLDMQEKSPAPAGIVKQALPLDAAALPVSGMLLPHPVAASGKDLPVDLPSSLDDSFAQSELVNGPLAFALPSTAAMLPQAGTDTPDALPIGAARPSPAMNPAITPLATNAGIANAASQVSASALAETPANTPVNTSAGNSAGSQNQPQPQEGTAVTLEVAAATDSSTQKDTVDAGALTDTVMGEAGTSRASLSSTTGLSTAGTTGAANGARFQPVAAAAPHDLAQIVERLATAREALAPATAAMAIDHADFGELSLRFEQRRDGQLAVQLAANDPDAHRAIAAAVAAERNGSTGSQTAGNSSTGGQQNFNGHTGDRTESGGRDSQGTRQDQHNPRRAGDGQAGQPAQAPRSGEILA